VKEEGKKEREMRKVRKQESGIASGNARLRGLSRDGAVDGQWLTSAPIRVYLHFTLICDNPP
jgi:hypothetical protein